MCGGTIVRPPFDISPAVGRRRSLATGSNIFERHTLWQLDRDHVALEHAEHHLHLGLEIERAVADNVLLHLDLL